MCFSMSAFEGLWTWHAVEQPMDMMALLEACLIFAHSVSVAAMVLGLAVTPYFRYCDECLITILTTGGGSVLEFAVILSMVGGGGCDSSQQISR